MRDESAQGRFEVRLQVFVLVPLLYNDHTLGLLEEWIAWESSTDRSGDRDAQCGKRDTPKTMSGSSSPTTRKQVALRALTLAPSSHPVFHRANHATFLPLTGTIGISTYAAKALGDVVYVELPTADLEVNQGDAIGAVESVKSASDINSPVSGTIIEANGVLEEKPGTINKGPEGEGWIAKIRVKDGGEVESLMGGEEYKKFTEE